MQAEHHALQVLQARQAQQAQLQQAQHIAEQQQQQQQQQQQHQQRLAAQLLAERAYQQQLALQQSRLPDIGPQMMTATDLIQAQQRQQLLEMTAEQQELMRYKAALQMQEQERIEIKRRRIAMKISRMVSLTCLLHI